MFVFTATLPLLLRWLQLLEHWLLSAASTHRSTSYSAQVRGSGDVRKAGGAAGTRTRQKKVSRNTATRERCMLRVCAEQTNKSERHVGLSPVAPR